jgi:glucose-6-phosphate isomerase
LIKEKLPIFPKKMSAIAVTECAEWRALLSHAEDGKIPHLRELLKDAERCSSLIRSFEGITLDLSRQRATSETLPLLLKLAEATGVQRMMGLMQSGSKTLNPTENRAVLHAALRAPKSADPILLDGQNVLVDVHEVLGNIKTFSDKIRSGELKGATGCQLTNVVSIGIGGSYLGVEYVYEALRKDPTAARTSNGRRLRFLANVDPVDVARALEGLSPESTLVLIVSKTFTTAETMLNAKTVRDWLIKGMPSENEASVVAKHMAAISTAVPLVTAFGISRENIFGFWDWVGGRYSVCSAVGMLPLALHYSFDIANEFLKGAHSIDQHFFYTPLKDNLPVLLGLFGVWNASFLGFSSRALLPYSQALLRLPAHIQQVSMESNGKRVNVDGLKVPFQTGEIEFGEPGTNGQHSFYQLLHQGRVVPCDFVGFCESQQPIHLTGEPVSNHDELMSNFFAQPDALAVGRTAEEVLAAGGTSPSLIEHKVFEGNRPSSSILLGKLNAYTTGQLLALFEHRTAVEGWVWGIASFDQWGVELGKKLAGDVRSEIKQKREAAISSQEQTAVKVNERFNISTRTLLEKYLSYKV